jgi:hypothetical protein
MSAMPHKLQPHKKLSENSLTAPQVPVAGDLASFRTVSERPATRKESA